MNVKEFINILKYAEDIDIAEIIFWVGDKTYELDSINQCGIVADVNILLKDVELPVMIPIKNFRRDKRKMINKKTKEIQNDKVRRVGNMAKQIIKKWKDEHPSNILGI